MNLNPATKQELQSLLIELFNQYGNDYDYNKIDTSLITDMSHLFNHNKLKGFNGEISKWNISNVQDKYSIFYGDTYFNQPIESWHKSKVINMIEMFAEASNFNQPINLWEFNGDFSKLNISTVQDIILMFSNATSLNQIPSWFK